MKNTAANDAKYKVLTASVVRSTRPTIRLKMKFLLQDILQLPFTVFNSLTEIICHRAGTLNRNLVFR